MKKVLPAIVLLVLAAGGAALWQFYLKDKLAENRAAEVKAAYDAAFELKGAEKVAALDLLLAKHGGELDAAQTTRANYHRFASYAETESPDAAKLLSYAEALDAATASHPRRFDYMNAAAYALAQNGVHLDRAETWAREALASVEKNGDDYDIANLRDTLAFVLLAAGKHEEAWPFAEQAAETLEDNSEALARAGQIAESLGKGETAADYYLKALAVFGNEDDSLYEESLKPLYVSLHGSDKGLAEKLDGMKEASRRYSVFEAPAVEEPSEAPAWTLPALDGGEGSLAALRGTAVLIKFWGYW